MLDGIGSVCMSEVISPKKEAVVKSCLASWKRQQSERNAHVASSTSDFLFLCKSFSFSLASFPHWNLILPPFSLPYISFVLALFWFTALMMGHRGDVIQVCSHACLSQNFTLYFSHVRGQCEAGIFCMCLLSCAANPVEMWENTVKCKGKQHFEQPSWRLT